MKQQVIPYCHAINFGFERHQMDDSTHIKQYGYDDFYVQFKVKKRTYAEWNRETRTLEVWREDRDGNIVSRLPIENLQHLQRVIEFLNPKKFKKRKEVIA